VHARRLLLKKSDMDDKENLIEPLLEKASQYGKTSIELMKLKAVGKLAAITGVLVSRSLLSLVLSFFAAFLNIAAALWLGNLLGQAYYGFLVVAGFYGVVGLLLVIIHPFIKTRVSNSVITQMLN
jgi:hypothetical protein